METFIVRVWVPPYSSEKEQPLCGVVEAVKQIERVCRNTTKPIGVHA